MANSAPNNASSKAEAAQQGERSLPSKQQGCDKKDSVPLLTNKALYAGSDTEGEEIAVSDLLYCATSTPPASPFFYSIDKEGKSARQSLELLRGCTDMRRYLLQGDSTYPCNLFNQ